MYNMVTIRKPTLICLGFEPTSGRRESDYSLSYTTVQLNETAIEGHFPVLVSIYM